MVYVLLIFNYALIFLITKEIFTIWVGIIFTLISVLVSLLFYKTVVGKVLVDILIKKKGIFSTDDPDGRRILLSAGFIGLALKLASIYGIYLLFGITIVLFIVILCVTGVLIEGKLEHFVGAYEIAKSLAKICCFALSWMDPIINFVIRLEFKKLGIETV